MDSPLRQIIVIGGGFSMDPDNPLLDQYVLEQTGVSRPKVCFLPTACGDADRNIMNFYAAFSRYDCRPAHLTLFGRTPDLRALLLDQQLIFVGGGNTRSMLAVWREWGLDSILREAWEAGVLLAGISAGAICWFEQGITDSLHAEMSVLNGLGLLKGSCCPHFDGQAERRPAFHAFLAEGRILPGYAIDDDAALHFREDQVVRVVAARRDAGAYRLQVSNGAVTEEPLSADYLGKP